MHQQTTSPTGSRRLAEEPTTRLPAVGFRRIAGKLTPPDLVAFAGPLALVVYLGLENGGFNQVVYSQIGVAAWWLLLVGLVAGALPARTVSKMGWIGVATLGAFAAWTALGVSWSPSAENSAVEVARVLTYLGVFAVVLVSGAGDRLRVVLGGVATGCAAVAIIALLSRLQPSWFPPVETVLGAENRLAYPLSYWNALAALVAIGLPLTAWAALAARALPLRALAAAAVPAMVLCGYYTLSRGGPIAAALAMACFVALAPRRLALLPGLAVLAGGSAALLWAASRRPSLAEALDTPTRATQGDAMLAIVVGVGLVTALCMIGLGLPWARARLARIPAVPRGAALAILVSAVAAAVIAFLALGGPERLAGGWEKFKDPGNPGTATSRLGSASGNGRWQYWSAAESAFESEPLHGIGPGTFVFWWNAHRDIPGTARDAHSLFVETLGELGIVGAVLIVALVVLVLFAGSRRALTAGESERLAFAAATGSAVAFTVAAGVDWLWEQPVVPIAFLIVAATLLGGPGQRRISAPGSRRWPRLAAAALGVAAAAGAIVAIALPMWSSEHIDDSRRLFRAGDLGAALDEAKAAQELQPYAATPLVQQALIHERRGDLSKAAAAAREATERESTNWETWYVLSRVQAQRDKRGPALRALRRARSLDPLSPLLAPSI